MANSFLKGAAQVHQSFWAEGFWASYNENPYTLDPAKAKALLAEAGYPDGFTLDLDAPNFAPFVNIAQSVQSTFAQGGVTVNIVSSEMAPMLTKYRAREHQALMVYWGPDYMDPHTNADGFVTNIDNTDAATGGKPLAWRNSWENAELTAATKAAAEESDEATRKADYIELQKKVLDEGPYIIMFQAISQRADRANVAGLRAGLVRRRDLLQPDHEVRLGAVPGFLDRHRATRLMAGTGPRCPGSRPAGIDHLRDRRVSRRCDVLEARRCCFCRRSGRRVRAARRDRRRPAGEGLCARSPASPMSGPIGIWVETGALPRHRSRLAPPQPASGAIRSLGVARPAPRHPRRTRLLSGRVGLELGFIPAADYPGLHALCPSRGRIARASSSGCGRSNLRTRSSICARRRSTPARGSFISSTRSKPGMDAAQMTAIWRAAALAEADRRGDPPPQSDWAYIAVAGDGFAPGGPLPRRRPHQDRCRLRRLRLQLRWRADRRVRHAPSQRRSHLRRAPPRVRHRLCAC